MESKGHLMTGPLYLQISEETENWWYGGERWEDLNGPDLCTSPHGSPEMSLLAQIDTDHHMSDHMKAMAGDLSSGARYQYLIECWNKGQVTLGRAMTLTSRRENQIQKEIL